VPVRLFPLRERIDDIEPLARAFFARHGYERARLSAAAITELKNLAWRGNVREFFNVLERAAIVAAGETIEPHHLLIEEVVGFDNDCPRYPESAVGDASELAGSLHPEEKGRSAVSVREMEEQLIMKTLKEFHDNRTQAAKRLGISVRTLRNKLKVYREKESREES
jgi:two-component system response regulator FlrC